MDNKLQKLIDLSRKTGDRIIAFDQSGQNDPFVVMSVDEYEKIVVGRSPVRGLTEEELADKINRDIAIWKSDQEIDENQLSLDKIIAENEVKNLSDDDYYGDLDDPYMSKEYDDIELEELFDDEEEEGDEEDNDWHSFSTIAREKEQFIKKNKKKKNWAIPGDRKKNAEEIIEEDRYYLEEVED